MHVQNHSRRGALVLLLATTMANPLTAAFADETTSAESADSSASVASLEEVTVTARRRAENLQVVPIAVNVLSGDTIRDQQIVSTLDLTHFVPGLAAGKITPSRNSIVFSMRGQTQIAGNGGPGVVAYFAEVPTQIAGSGYMFDLENVQVLKGPQGTLFGRNTTGGAILLQPQRPTKDLDGFVDVSFGDYDLRRVSAAINIPVIADTLLVRIAVDNNSRTGFTHDVSSGMDVDDRNYTAARVGITFRPTEALENYLLLDTYRSDTHGTGQVLTDINPAGAALKTFPGLAQALIDQRARGPWSTATAGSGRKLRRTTMARFTLS
jgi:iron complex outermembrane receptor protein